MSGGPCPSEPVGENPSFIVVVFSGLSGGCQSLAFLGLQLHHSNLSLWCHMTFSLCVCLQVAFFLFCKNTSHRGLGSTSMTSSKRGYSCKFPKKVTVTRTEVGLQHTSFGGHDSTHDIEFEELGWTCPGGLWIDVSESSGRGLSCRSLPSACQQRDNSMG